MAAPAESKLILLCEGKLSSDELKLITQHLVAVLFDSELHVTTDLEALMRRFQLLILDINDTKTRKWWGGMRGLLARNADWIVLYKLKKGVKTEVDAIDTLKTRFGVRHVLKYLPDNCRTVAEFIARITDHIPSGTSCLETAIKKIVCR